MADFIETSNTKTATRKLASPIADAASFQGIIQSVIDNNPFECTDYIQNNATHSGVEVNRESYTAKIVFEDNAAEKIGSLSIKCPTVSSMNSATGAILADADLAVAVGGDPVRDAENDTYSCQLKCHDTNTEIYYVTFSRETVRVSSYQDDSILAKVETWADTIAALA
ncbi:conserved hypothetical protein [Methanolacinia petrolearia DSM 11571]|uniref:Uncharacterized protein n=1 Tax=Methanolacinia petrolearia (strain DSM 11571 / OCM 486 / SEBR 4847) TaxID=679926 RepID=E1RHC2_METP4|nr:hypothetical protein [Methanolacinia petrolearia]ADN36426.1 conserved hypothetical protein [Methanolacinia petrolearia DSM 11571]